MTKDWSVVEDEARYLYSAGMSLQKLRTKLVNQHGFDASTRAWRNKIKDWGAKKDRTPGSLTRSSCPKCGVMTTGGQRRRGLGMLAASPPIDRNAQRGQNGDISDSLDLAGQVAVQKIPNKEVHESLRTAWETGKDYDRILRSATFANGEENILHYMARSDDTFIGGLCILDTIIKHMLQHKYSLHALDEHGQTALDIAIKTDNDAVSSFLCWTDPASVNSGHRNGSFLHLAILYSSWSICRELMLATKNGSSKDAQGFTPLQLAARLGRSDIVIGLLGCGVTIDDEDMLVSLVWSPRLTSDCRIELLEKGLNEP